MNKLFSLAKIGTRIRLVILGILLMESWYFSGIIASRFNQYIIINNYEEYSIYGVLGVLILIIFYITIRGVWHEILRVIKSKRWDVIVSLLLGLFVSYSFSGIGVIIYDNTISRLSLLELLSLVSVPVVLSLLVVLDYLRNLFYKDKERLYDSPFFIPDKEETSTKNDFLDMSSSSEKFAERVWNGGSSNSMVFGIDGPWGIGKSTFIKFCIEHWNKKHKKDIIIYYFTPLRYEGNTNFLEKFLDGFINIIQKYVFAPELKSIMSKYSRFIKDVKGKFSIPGFSIELSPGSYTADDAFEDLDELLSKINKRIIIVIDDLDRLSFKAIKDVLFVIKKSFALPNVSYVLCYDTENISSLEERRPEIDKITEFLEKFVNVKINLYLENVILIKYIENLKKILIGNSQADPILISQAIGGLIDIYKAEDYHLYLPFVGDIRKLKRLINTLVLLEIEQTNFKDSDFNKQDLINLLLIYINYPSIFRKIYNTETDGKRGFFSVVMPHDNGYPRASGARVVDDEYVYKNSLDYDSYIEGLPSNKQRFLLNKIFRVKDRLKKYDSKIDSIPEELKKTYACFNGSWGAGRNLEEYLKLIVNLSKPIETSQYTFYKNQKDALLKGTDVVKILEKPEFAFSVSEENHASFWKVITNSLSEFDNKTGNRIISYIINNITNYSLLTNQKIGIGFRDDLAMYLTMIIDKVGWGDDKGGHVNNTEDNIKNIAKLIFGEEKYIGKGVIDILSKEDRGVLGLYDLLGFRLFCSADRRGDIFNLQRALSKHGSPDAPTEGRTDIIAIEEMREISQIVFKIFKNQYIDKKINILEEVDNLELRQLAGSYYEYVEENIKSGRIKRGEINLNIAEMKSRMKSFIVYQLGNELISSGVGCGYYDINGKDDKHGIKKEMNEYLFQLCFNDTIDVNNYERFLDYLLINLASAFRSEAGESYVPSINEFTKVLDKKMLLKYWKDNHDKIKSLKLDNKKKIIKTPNYVVNYNKHLIKIYNVLDAELELVEDKK